MVNVKSARPEARPSSSSSWSRILLLADSECGTKQSALEAAVACFARRRLSNVPEVCVSQPQPLVK